MFNARAGVRLTERADLTVAVENMSDKLYRAFGARHDGPGVNFIVAVNIRW